MIEFVNVTKKFGDRIILDELNLKIPKGKITVILGKSGEGKSVTIKHIIGLLKPTSGKIFFDNVDITKLQGADLLEYRKKFGMLFQHAALFDSLSVEENILFPLREHTKLSLPEMKKRAQEVLHQAGLENILKKFPGDLSTGEKKRVGLARALAPKPKVILYDEPTTGMDPLICEMIDNLIVKVNHEEPDLTSIVISHDLKAALDTAEFAVMLYKGKVQKAGEPKTFKNCTDPIINQFFSGKVEGPMELI